eukprot:TRINITY_DN1303_c0_g3_i1.p1 TRINITY_DN1303_c0_g3~~TRINITY_DN1303_c0_g3_i1.p1  ORF type:complete len:326 (-),score=44.20 TRINITY_DN1303_c0_g3_i1:212-1189(-)
MMLRHSSKVELSQMSDGFGKLPEATSSTADEETSYYDPPDEETTPVVYRDTYKLFKIDEVPKWLHEPHILSGYRVFFTLKLCVKSLFRVHNETGNVWTHLIGFFIYLGLTIYTLHTVVPSGDIESALIFCVFLFSVMFCMLCSASFHLFLCHDEAAFKRMLRADLTGVSVQIFGSFIPGLYYGFACYPTWRTVYMCSVSAMFIVGILAPMFDRFHTREFRFVRVGVYSAMGAFGLIPLIHWIVVRGAHSPQERHFIWLFGLMFALYAIGIMFYVTKVPERWLPGRFDIWFHSHQWWHLFVMMAPVVYYVISVQQLQLRIAGLTCM